MNDGLPDPNSLTIIDMASMIVNNISTQIDQQTGAIYTETLIWLQFNNIVWVRVPSKYLVPTT